MSKALYLNDTYLLETPAIILAYEIDEKGNYLLLDQTIFYPQGGGQPSDQGLIKGKNFEINVLHVRQIEQEIRHYIDHISNVNIINTNVTLILDKNRRMINAKYHTAAHLIGNIVELIYPTLKATKGHSFPKEAYVEFQGEMLVDPNKIIETLKEYIDKDLVNRTIKYAELNLPIPEASLRGIDGKFSFGPFCFDYNNRGKPRGIYPKEI